MFYLNHRCVLFLTCFCAAIAIPHLFTPPPTPSFFSNKDSYLSQSLEHEQKELWQPIDRDMA